MDLTRIAVVPRKYLQRIANNEYVPYNALARGITKSHNDEERTLKVNTDGSVNFSKEVNRTEEEDISMADWLIAADVMVHYVKKFHDEDRARAYEAHNKVVSRLNSEVDWPVAVLYDIEIRQKLDGYCFNHRLSNRHDVLSGLNTYTYTTSTPTPCIILAACALNV